MSLSLNSRLTAIKKHFWHSRCILGKGGVMEWVISWGVWECIAWEKCLGQSCDTYSFFFLFFFLLLRRREKINFIPNVHFSALYWKLKFLSIWHEIFAFLRERKKSNWERRRWMLLPLLNTQITSSFSQEMRTQIQFCSFVWECLWIF